LSAKRVLLYLVLAGLLVRVVYLGEVSALPFFHDPVGDSARYLDRAREIAAGDMVGDRPFFYGGMLYPYMIALDLLVFGENLYPICLAQALAGCALAWVIHALVLAGARTGGGTTPVRAAAVAAAALALFYGPFAFLEADLLMISWTLLLLMSAALLLVKAAGEETREGRGRRIAWIGTAGLCLGLAASERPNLVALLPALAIWVLLCVPAPSRFPGMLALLAGGGVVLAGVTAINHAASGRWIPLTTSSGINFYIGNNPGARGTFDEPWTPPGLRPTGSGAVCPGCSRTRPRPPVCGSGRRSSSGTRWRYRTISTTRSCAPSLRRSGSCRSAFSWWVRWRCTGSWGPARAVC